MCNFHLDGAAVSGRFGIDFDSYFARELQELREGPLVDGFLEMDEGRLDLTPRGRLFVRNVCMAFDRYLDAMRDSERPAFSRTV
jgi:oxygen-independent coproporphyrinogen-3 oxidase